jgi:hypothetical protein
MHEMDPEERAEFFMMVDSMEQEKIVDSCLDYSKIP